MTVNLPSERDFEAQAVEAGFSTLEAYLVSLLDRDAERLAIRQGIEDAKVGQLRPFEEFDNELRREFGFAPRT